MVEQKPSVREKIILATIEGIEEQGIQSLTVRDIAQRADVNIAAINYHFGSKDNLMEIALHQTIDEAFVNMITEELGQKDRDPASALCGFFTALLSGLRQFPGLTRAHLYGPLMENDFRGVFPVRFKTFITNLHQKCREFFREMPDKEIQLVLMEILSAVIFPGLTSGLFEEYTGIDFDDPEAQKNYVTHLVHRYFGEFLSS